MTQTFKDAFLWFCGGIILMGAILGLSPLRGWMWFFGVVRRWLA